MPVQLTPQLEDMVKQKIDAGLYRDADEVLHEALQLLDQRDQLQRLRTSLDEADAQIDRGQGIPEALAERIFEPFVTSESRGTGLGLFLARELAQANGATLIFEPRPGGGSVFRLVFSDPLRWRA